MKFVLVDGDQESLQRETRCLASVFPDAGIVSFFDALSAYKYCVNCANKIALAFIPVLLKPFDGLKLFELLSKLPTPVNAVMMLQEDSTELRELVKLKGSCLMIVKPITPEKILAIAREVVNDCLSEDLACMNCALDWCETGRKRRSEVGNF